MGEGCVMGEEDRISKIHLPLMHLELLLNLEHLQDSYVSQNTCLSCILNFS